MKLTQIPIADLKKYRGLLTEQQAYQPTLGRQV